MFHTPNRFRVRTHPILGSDDSYGNNGFFIFNFQGYEVRVQASDGMGWEHCSVSINRQRTPTWETMCKVKDLFWDKEDSVIQYHPPESKYVNMHQFCLHLWRSTEFEITVPDTILLGIK
jgi:hypothetical protein